MPIFVQNLLVLTIFTMLMDAQDQFGNGVCAVFRIECKAILGCARSAWERSLERPTPASCSTNIFFSRWEFWTRFFTLRFCEKLIFLRFACHSIWWVLIDREERPAQLPVCIANASPGAGQVYLPPLYFSLTNMLATVPANSCYKQILASCLTDDAGHLAQQPVLVPDGSLQSGLLPPAFPVNHIFTLLI